jgi:ABC-type glycerol-3-phosphate transport system permease component
VATRPAGALDAAWTERRETAAAAAGRRAPAVVRRLPLYLLLALLTFVFLFPWVFMFASSFKPSGRVLADIGSWQAFWPSPFRPRNYSEVFERVPLERYMLNSFFVTFTTLVSSIFVNSLAAYAFAMLRFRGSDVLFAAFVALLIIPFEAIFLPLFLTINEFGWLNSYQGLIVPFIANVLYIFLFRQFFLGIPRDLIESARIDGASFYRIYRSIVMPLSVPVISTVAILEFLARWNDFFWPLITLTDDRKYTAQLGLTYFFQGERTQWALVMAATVVITVPLLIVFLIFQRFFVRSVATTGLKG